MYRVFSGTHLCSTVPVDSTRLSLSLSSASRGVRAGPDRSRYRDPKKNILTRDHREQTQHLDQLPIYALSVFFVLFSFLNDTLEYVEKETIVGFPVGALVGTVTDLETTPYFS